MWLLNTETLRLEEFHKDRPKYAILSHRWEEGQELTFGHLERSPPTSTGYVKVKGFCHEARRKGFDYVWTDTCCIDRKSSAELSEAINSMYKWYREAEACYVYLSDVGSKAEFEESGRDRHSEWFDRGWTLQELLAPSELHFFDRDWGSIGSRKDFIEKIQEITRIPCSAISSFHATNYCIAEKMSWYGKRKTTREEDRAYCLLGLFDTNIPLLYGEGSRAFQRLQEEIMKSSTDLSLFLWSGSACDTFGMLASDPVCFSDSLETLQLGNLTQDTFKLSSGWSVNNGGISMTASIFPYAIADGLERVVVLYLHERFRLPRSGFVIFLRQTTIDSEAPPSYQRVVVNGASWKRMSCLNTPRFLTSGSGGSKLFIARQPIVELRADEPKRIEIQVNSDGPFHCELRARRAGHPPKSFCNWPIKREGRHRGFKCSVSLQPGHIVGLVSHMVVTQEVHGRVLDFLICLGFDREFQPFCVFMPLCEQRYRYDERLTVLSAAKSIYDLVNSGPSFQPNLCEVGSNGRLAFTTQPGLNVEITPSDSGLAAAITVRPDDWFWGLGSDS